MNSGTSERVAGAAGDATAGTPARLGQLETDRFCDGCGYNLHGQIVTRDERLGIPVCRCPECGRHHAATGGTTALHLWLKRVGTLVLVVWVLAVCCLALAGTIGFGMLSHSNVRADTVWEQTAVDQLPPGYPPGRYTPGSWFGSDDPQRYRVMRRNVREEPEVDYYRGEGGLHYAGLTEDQARLASLAAAGLAWGAFIGIALWHLRLRRCVLVGVLVAPALAGAVVVALWWLNAENYMVRGWALPRVAGYALVQSAFVAVGVRVGRSFARSVVHVVLPPKPRQALAFLWLGDGRTPPGVG